MANLEKMTAAELEKLAKEAVALAARKKEDEKKELRAKLVEQIKEAGYNIEDIFPGAGSVKAKTASSGVKYQDPSNPANTWTGRGRKPSWLVEAESAGRSLEEFEVK